MLHRTLLLLALSSLSGDIEQLNSFDNLVLREDDSSFANIPSGATGHMPISSIGHHVRNSPYCHGNHIHRVNSAYETCDLHHHSHAHLKHRGHKKDSFGHHYYHTHYSNRNNVSPMKDVYMPINSYHYPGFPFKDTILYGNTNEPSSGSDESDAKLQEVVFH
ncbi:hypothetical protein COBT_000028 [Conglomerata obtusa]